MIDPVIKTWFQHYFNCKKNHSNYGEKTEEHLKIDEGTIILQKRDVMLCNVLSFTKQYSINYPMKSL